MISTHSQRLERWLGAPVVEQLSQNFRRWYGPPVAVAGVPGSVFVTGDGDFIGECHVGAEISALEKSGEILCRPRRFSRQILTRDSFSSLSALITAATAGKKCTMPFSKVGTAPTAIGGSIDLWGVGNMPAAGSAGAAAPGGTSPTSSTTGALGFVNAVVNANTSHFVNAWALSNFINSLLLCDRLLEVAKTMASTGTEAVTGTFSRYQNATAGADDFIGGNFMYPRVSGVLSATAHNWTVCQYTDDGSNTGNSAPSATGVSAGAANQIDLAVGPASWFMPLATGDLGVKALTQMQCSASVTGTLDFIVAHAIAVIPIPLVNIAMNVDAVASAFNLQKIFDNACLYFIELSKPATNATTYSGIVASVSE